jgi:hypothetical protein
VCVGQKRTMRNAHCVWMIRYYCKAGMAGELKGSRHPVADVQQLRTVWDIVQVGEHKKEPRHECDPLRESENNLQSFPPVPMLACRARHVRYNVPCRRALIHVRFGPENTRTHPPGVHVCFCRASFLVFCAE